jgi:hypothetical protein
LIGDLKTVRVSAARWEAAFSTLDDAGLPVALVGRALRVPGVEPAQVERALRAAQVDARLDVVQATFEEAFVTMARGHVATTAA